MQRQADVALAANEREKARIEQAALEETLRVMGVQQKPISPEVRQKVDEALAKADEALAEGHARLDMAQRQGVARAIDWSHKCMAFSQEQLAKLRR